MALEMPQEMNDMLNSEYGFWMPVFEKAVAFLGQVFRLDSFERAVMIKTPYSVLF